MRLLLLTAILTSLPALAFAQACVQDAALTEAAQVLVEREAPPSPSALLDAVRAAGSDVPVVDALIIRDGDARRRDRFVTRVSRRRAGAPIVCGEAQSGGRWLVLAAPRQGRIEVGEDGVIHVELGRGFHAPRVYAQDARGRIWQRDAGAPLILPDDLVPPVRVQLIAVGPQGPRPIAERRVGEGLERTVAPSDRPLGERLAALRVARDLGALRDNRLLTRVATQHAERVCREGRVSHLAEGSDPRERLARAGLRARHVGEVIARAEDPSRAYAALVRSPSHRAALTDGRFTDVGIGSAEDGAGHACVVVLLAAWPRPVPY